MALMGYRVDALRARLGAWWQRLLGLAVGPGARVHPGVVLRHGPGSSLGAGCVLYRDVHILATGRGRFAIGARSHIAPRAYVLVGPSELRIGDDVAIGPGLILSCVSQGTSNSTPFAQQQFQAPVHIGHNVFIGAGVTVLPGARIDDGVVVAAGAVVRGHLGSGWLYAGVPARPVRPLAA